MTPEDFRRQWTEWATREDVPASLRASFAALETYGSELAGVSLRNADRLLMQSVGLPREAAPFLNFRRPSKEEDESLVALEAAGLLEIGSDGSGDMICLDSATGQVLWLDHEPLYASDE